MPFSNGSLERLASLFLYWYGTHRSIRRCLASPSQDPPEEELPAPELEHAWRTKWFAKGDLTALVDREMADLFGDLLMVLEDDLDMIHDNIPFWTRMSLIVLYDQIPRNVHRGTTHAYHYDDRARRLALPLIQSHAAMPVCFRATTCICLCHSETLESQQLLQSYLGSIHYNHNSYESIFQALQTIADKHMERVRLFGRFPERNAALHRQSTEKEHSYLQQL